MCRASPVAGGGLGHASGPAVLVTCAAEIRSALDWLPGRIVILEGAALAPSILTLVVRSAQLATIRGVVLLADEAIDPAPLAAVGGCVPVVSVDRESDKRCIRRAALLGVDVHHRQPFSLDLRHRRAVDLRPRNRLGSGHQPGVVGRLGSPGEVRPGSVGY